MVVLLFVLGLVIGSFLGALTYRLPRDLDMVADRSRCPNCKKVIVWYDNIPLLSYIFLRGRCGNCKQKISFRYPVIEFATAVAFVFVGLNIINLFVVTVLIIIFVIDLEHQIIPDELVFLGLLAAILNSPTIFSSLLAGLLAANLLLFLNLITKGKGMGLGDVKLAIFIGAIIGMKLIFVWILFSFVVGALIGIILIVAGEASLKQRIAFGPFLIIGFLMVNLFGQNFLNWIGI